jgi:signal transduction histidine kinase
MSALRRAFGLRPRLLLALVLTSAVTLGAAALALLNPLQDRLRQQSRDSLRAAAAATRPRMEDALRADRKLIVDADAPVFPSHVAQVASDLSRDTGARVAVFRVAPSLNKIYDTGTTNLATDDVYRVYISDPPRQVASSRGAAERVATPLRTPQRGTFWVMAVRQTDTGVSDAVDEVQSAFGKAALIGLGVALLLALLISTTLSRRLTRLRHSAQRLALEGTDAPAPTDDGLDEVGDLARALASMQVALRRQEEARRAFVATASHELRTPLTSLQGNLELLAEDLEEGRVDVADAKAQIAGAQGQLGRLRGLATELLDLSRLDAGVTLRREPIDLGELCRAVSAEFELRATDLQVTLDLVHPPAPVWAGGDPGAVARILRILLDNALRFSTHGQLVRVEAAYRGEDAVIEVSDRGPGVPPAERDLIFERFQRGSSTGGAGGFGLGLAIGREMAERMGGRLELVSRRAAAGATFVCTLPIELPRGGSDDPHHEDEPARAGSSPK